MLVVARAAGGRGDPRVLLMAGVVVGAFANAAIMVALANAQANVVRGALWWMMGSVSDASWPQVGSLAAIRRARLGGAARARARDRRARARRRHRRGARRARRARLVRASTSRRRCSPPPRSPPRASSDSSASLVPHLVRWRGARTPPRDHRRGGARRRDARRRRPTSSRARRVRRRSCRSARSRRSSACHSSCRVCGGSRDRVLAT